MSAVSIEAIKQAVGPNGWLSDPADTLKYRTDWRGKVVGEALLVIRPASTKALSEAMRLAYDNDIAVVPQGGNTGLVAGSVPTEARPTMVVSTDRLTQVRSVDPDNYALVAEAGCIVQKLQEEAAAHGRMFPLSLASEGSCTLGGTLSTNAGGNQTIRFGNAREQVLGLEAVLPDGTIFEGLNTLRKNNTGYDLKQLFIGAEGTLGLITAAAIRLVPLPTVRVTAMVAVPGPAEALRLLELSRRLSGDAVLAFELLPRYSLDLAMQNIEGVVDPLDTPSPWYVLMEVATASEIDDLDSKVERIVADAMEAGWVSDGVIAQSEAQRSQLWRPREEQAEAGRRAGPAISCDVSVPVVNVPAFLVEAEDRLRTLMPRVELNTFGHMGDGNIHYSARKPADLSEERWLEQAPRLHRALLEVVAAHAGSFSAEHGIGSEKRGLLGEFASGSRLNLMRTIKNAVDPKGLMNPGKILS